jgi:hypothetical protein
MPITPIADRPPAVVSIGFRHSRQSMQFARTPIMNPHQGDWDWLALAIAPAHKSENRAITSLIVVLIASAAGLY